MARKTVTKGKVGKTFTKKPLRRTGIDVYVVSYIKREDEYNTVHDGYIVAYSFDQAVGIAKANVPVGGYEVSSLCLQSEYRPVYQSEEYE